MPNDTFPNSSQVGGLDKPKRCISYAFPMEIKIAPFQSTVDLSHSGVSNNTDQLVGRFQSASNSTENLLLMQFKVLTIR